MPRLMLPILCMAALLAPSFAQAETVIEKKIRDTRPCKGMMIGPVDLSRERRVRVRTVSMSVDDDRFELNLDGALACQSPAAAFIQTHIGADVTLKAEGSFQDCSAVRAQVTLRNLESPELIRSLLVAATPDLEANLTQQATRELAARCSDFSNSD